MNQFCFTSDVEWAKEKEIESMLSFFFSMNVPLTLFTTHPSKAVSNYYDTPHLRQHVGLHFNFCSGSTQGKTEAEIIQNVRAIWPSANFYRNHRLYDTPALQETLRQNGFVFDSNSICFLQECFPIRLPNGVVRFPVFWEDDVHLKQVWPWKVEAVTKHLNVSRLKIFNFHPQIVYGDLHASADLHLMKDLLTHILSLPNSQTVYLKTLYNERSIDV